MLTLFKQEKQNNKKQLNKKNKKLAIQAQGLDANKLLFEARDELTGTQNQHAVLVGTALKRLAVDLAQVRHGHAVAVCSRAVFRIERCVVLGDLGNLLVDFFFSDFNDRTLDFDTGEINDLEARQDVVGHLEGKIGVASHDLLSIFFRQIDFRGQSRALGALLNSLLGRFLDGVRQDLGHGLTAIHLFQMGERNLARAEALDVGLGFQVGHVIVELGGEITSRNVDFQLTLEALGEGFGYLHGFCRPRSRAAIRPGGFVFKIPCATSPALPFCRERSNGHASP